MQIKNNNYIFVNLQDIIKLLLFCNKVWQHWSPRPLPQQQQAKTNTKYSLSFSHSIALYSLYKLIVLF